MNNESPLCAVSETEAAARRPDGTFGPGNRAGAAGRPKGLPTGRQQALALIDRFLSEAETMAALESAMREAFNADPLDFYKKVVAPILPRETRLKVAQAEGIVEWRSILTTFPLEPTDRPDESGE